MKTWSSGTHHYFLCWLWAQWLLQARGWIPSKFLCHTTQQQRKLFWPHPQEIQVWVWCFC